MSENLSQKSTLWQEWMKVWRWIVFVFRLLGQMGGIRGIAKALGQAIMIPLSRGLRQHKAHFDS